jgi:hypothetical protein
MIQKYRAHEITHLRSSSAFDWTLAFEGREVMIVLSVFFSFTDTTRKVSYEKFETISRRGGSLFRGHVAAEYLGGTKENYIS